ncbi:MAG TPA: ribosome silencing factor [Kiritimatiellia bacterium]|mgnify:CR=1 FL=1|nr:ribosome silencing factor [Kiritimatiellia bacterium]
MKAARETLDGKKAGEIVVLDVRKLSTITDYYVIATGNNTRHLKALADEVGKAMKQLGSPAYRQSGSPDSGWIVADFLDFVVHLFDPEAREHYALEALWKDAPVIE